MRMLDLLNQIDAIVWGPWLLVLLVGTGVYLTIRLRLLQMVKLPRALRLIFFARNKGDGDIDSFKALCTALAATVGTGNIVGVATAIKLGGPGALFWMWVAAFFGMATKYAEGCLAVKFRSIDEMEISQADRCITLSRGWERNGNLWRWHLLSSVRSPLCSDPVRLRRLMPLRLLYRHPWVFLSCLLQQ